MLTLGKRPESTQVSEMEFLPKWLTTESPICKKLDLTTESRFCIKLNRRYFTEFWMPLNFATWGKILLWFFLYNACLLTVFRLPAFVWHVSNMLYLFFYLFSKCVFCYFCWYFLIFAFFWEGNCFFSFFFGLMSFVLSCVSLFTYFSLSF